MKFTFFEKKIKISDDIRAYAEKKIGKMDKFFRNDTDATVTFSEERGRYRAEVTLHNNGMYYRVSELTSDMCASIDSACAAIERQIRKNKTRLEKRLREGAFDRSVSAMATAEEPEEDNFDIVRTKRFSIKPMAPEEAILQMNLLEHEFFAFKNQEDDAFSVVYRRKDGGYGLISASDV
jgi:putative sigma-54 modulation protein